MPFRDRSTRLGRVGDPQQKHGPGEINMNTTAAKVVSSDVLAAQLQEIIVEYDSYKKQYRRAEPRESVSIPVEAVELDDDFMPLSDPIHMVTRDISTGGMGMFHTQRLSAKYLRLQFSSPFSLESFSVIGRVEHCTPCGKYFIIGCAFVTDRLDSE